jgi:hypothetical protein
VGVKLKLIPRFLRRTNNRRLAIAGAVVAVFVVCIGLFVKSYHDSGPTAPIGAHGSGPSGGITGYPTDGASGSPKPGSTFFPTAGGNITLPVTTLSGVVGGGLSFAPGSTHKVTLSATSAVSMVRVGYLAPTSPDSPYGDIKGVGTHWSVTITALGRPAYAIIFIQAGAAGIPITCKITVDGHVSNTATTSGPYGRTVCLG